MPSLFLLLISTSLVFLVAPDVDGGLQPISFGLSSSTVAKPCVKDCKEMSIKLTNRVHFEAAVRPQMFFGFLKFVGKALGVVGSLVGIVQKTSSDHQTADEFNKVFEVLDRNLQSVSNVQESIDLLMTKSLDAIGNLDHDLEQSTARILADIDDVSKKVDRNYGYLLKVFQKVSATYTSVERTRLEMHLEFKTLFEFMKNNYPKIQSTLTKMNNFVSYFANEKARISQLSRQERVATYLEANGFLQNLRQSRTPRGDSLQSFLYEVTSQNYAIPQNINDSVAFAALNSMYYGVQTQISVLWYLMKAEVYLADDSYRAGDIDRFNEHMEHVVTDFQGFSSYLLGGIGTTGLLDQAIDILVKVTNLKFTENSAGLMVKLLARIGALKQAKIQLQQATLPLITDTPEKLTTKIKFDGRSLKTPIGDWEDGAKVRYAIQYKQGDLYSRVGEWSEPFHIKGKANPRLRIPAHSLYSRIIFRRFNDETPQYIGTLERGNENDFWDINRDLYDAASGSDEEIAMRDAKILIDNGANVSAQFDLGRCAIHAAAMNGNANLTKLLLNEVTSNSLDFNNYTPLHLAAENGWADLIDLLTQSGSQVNAKAKCGSTPLHLAAANGYPSAVQALVRSDGIDMNAQDEDGSCPLHKAVLNGVDEVVKILFADKRKDLNLQAKGKFTPLHLSAMLNNSGTTKLLLTSPSIATNARTDGNLTAVHLAAITGNVPALRELVGKGCTKVNARSVNGWTSLHYAVSLLRPAVVTELLKTDVIVDVLGAGQITPLHIAAATDQGQVVGALLQHGAAIDLPNDQGLTPLHLAAINNNTDTVKVLLDKAANFHARTRDDSTVIHLAAARSSLLTVKFILEHETRAFERNNKTETPLDIALKNDRTDVAELIKTKADISAQFRAAANTGTLDTVKSLLELGAMLEEEDTNTGRPALTFAANTGHKDIVKFLLEKGAYIDHRDHDRRTPLLYTFTYATGADMAKYLLGLGANVNASDKDQRTLLHLAAQSGHMDIVTLLLDNGAKVNPRDSSKQTPLFLAKTANQGAIVTYLQSKGGTV